MNSPRLLIIAVLGAAAGLSACGKTGLLDQPAPLFGAKSKADYEAQQKTQAEQRAAKKAEPQPDVDPNGQPLTQAPYAAPIPGVSSPFTPGPQGALPNPGTSATDR